jgi:phosphoribosyl-dephospho-CoA transferase
MTSHSHQNNQNVRRHDLIFVSTASWHSLLMTRSDLIDEPLVIDWADQGRPLVARRAMPGETIGVALGLPLPPFAGKRRIAFVVQPEDIVSTAPPLALSATIDVAPEPWRRTLDQVANLAWRHGVAARVFGSLAWQMLTGLNYLTASSDLDLLLLIRSGIDLAQLTTDLAAIEAVAPMRLDGELVRDDGVGVNWREIHSGAREVLVKGTFHVDLVDTNRFLSNEILP